MVVIPDILALASPGERAECQRDSSRQNGMAGQDGVKGLRALGCRDLSYRLGFIANSVQVGNFDDLTIISLSVTSLNSSFHH